MSSYPILVRINYHTKFSPPPSCKKQSAQSMMPCIIIPNGYSTPFPFLQRTIIGGSCHKYKFFHNKSFVMTNMSLPWQNRSFDVTKVCLSSQNFCRNKHICHDKFCWESLLLLWQTRVCCNKTCLLLQLKYACCNKTFAMTNMCLSRQTFLLQQNYVCHDKTFVETKIILVAAPANDREQPFIFFFFSPPPPPPPFFF